MKGKRSPAKVIYLHTLPDLYTEIICKKEGFTNLDFFVCS